MVEELFHKIAAIAKDFSVTPEIKGIKVIIYTWIIQLTMEVTYVP